MLKFPGDGDDSDVVWIYKGDVFRPAEELDTVLLLDRGGIVYIVHPKVRDIGDQTCSWLVSSGNEGVIGDLRSPLFIKVVHSFCMV